MTKYILYSHRLVRKKMFSKMSWGFMRPQMSQYNILNGEWDFVVIKGKVIKGKVVLSV